MSINDIDFERNDVFVICEIGNNHNGDVKKAKRLIDHAKEIGADCVKFQMRNLESVYRSSALQEAPEDLGVEYVIQLLKKFELSTSEHKELFDYCDKVGIFYLCTAWDKKSVDILESFNVKGYKVASADLTNIDLINYLVETKKPLILSTGMSEEDEIDSTIEFLKSKNAKFSILHCNSTYPAPLGDINLRYIERLREKHKYIGYSGHERGIAVSVAAVALGAKIIERHLTLDRLMEGPDHAASLEPTEFKELIKSIREVEYALGSNSHRKMSQGEMINRENLGKSIVAARKIDRGEIIKREDLKICSPGQGLSPQKIKILIGKHAKRSVEFEEFFYDSDLIEDSNIEFGNYKFKRPWGLPVRYHDINNYVSKTNLDLVEFHLSASDLDIEFDSIFYHSYECNFLVHAPELFSNSHLMDLTSCDELYLNKTLEQTQRVINITKKLKKYFPKTEIPKIILNVGGFSMDKQYTDSEINEAYFRLKLNLKRLILDGVELLPQTMAPFPWHFGGQRYQNLFLKANEIKQWCESTNMRICLDVSHSKLACNYFNTDFYNFIDLVSQYTAHIHMGDASKLNGEGMQIGTGEIDFARLMNILDKNCPTASFIPEIWQGHKDNGLGFKIALEKLGAVKND